MGPTIALQLSARYEHDKITGILKTAGAGPMPPEVPAYLAGMGDPERGRELTYSYCDGCHRIAAGDPELTGGDASLGPPLIGLIGRPVADLQGYDYSEALIAYGGTRTPEGLYEFALSPALTAPGAVMNYAPARTPQLIADIAAYFVSVAD